MTTRRTLLTGVLLAAKRDRVRLLARPAADATVVPGLRRLELRRDRDAQLYIPQSVAASGKPAPFLMYLHGAGGASRQGIKWLGDLADRLGVVLLSPSSTGRTWDAIRGNYGPDVRALDKALGKAFEVSRADPKRIGVCGFSDGASYALGLGLANGDLFRSVMAFSPGFIPPPFEPSGAHPRVFLSHGTGDTILPIETCSRVLVPDLKQSGYPVTYVEFDGPHRLPPDTAERALGWFLE